jgi:hypothetical protein
VSPKDEVNSILNNLINFNNSGLSVSQYLAFRKRSIMASEKVSAAFKQSFAKLGGIDDAKQAEASMNSIPVPAGWKGRCQVVDMVMDVSKPKSDGKGGNPYINFTVVPVDDEKYLGKKITKNYTLSEYVNPDTKAVTTPADRYERFLNEMEWAGLPRELRVGHDGPEDIINWWLDPDENRMVDVEVVENKVGGRTFINVNMRKPAESVDSSDSAVPPEPSRTTSAATSSTPAADAKKTVKFNGKDWELISEDGDNVVIKSQATGRERTVKRSELDK